MRIANLVSIPSTKVLYIALFALPALVLAANCFALDRIHRSAEQLRGRSLGLLGLTLCTLWLLPAMGWCCSATTFDGWGSVL